MSANIRELLIGFGKGKQTDISTANLVAAVWQLKKLNAQLSELTDEQAAYISVPKEGPYKAEHYRY